MVPLEKAHDGAARNGHGVVVVQERKPPPEKPPAPRLPRRFKVVEVVSQRVLAEGADTRTTVELLEGRRSVVDVSVYVWEDQRQRWQQLTQREKQMLWDLRGRERRS